MSYLPEHSAIKVDAELEKALQTADFESIKDLMRDKAMRDGLVVPDPFDSSVMVPVLLEASPTAQSNRFAKTITDATGTKLISEGNSELEVERKMGDYFRSLAAHPKQQVEQPRDDAGRFTTTDNDDANLVAKTELELAFKTGRISTQDFLAASGAIDTYLEKKGILLDDLRYQTQKLQRDWESATNGFLAQNSTWWPGGFDVTQKIGEELARLGLTDQPSVESLEAAVRELQSRGELPPSPEVEEAEKQQAEILKATSHEDLRRVLGGSSSLFGRF